MTRPYSMDLRARAVALVEKGHSRRAVAELLRVGASTVINWVKRHRATGSCAPKAMGGKRRVVLLPERDWLLARMAAAPDLTVRALRAELLARGIKVSYGAVWSFLAPKGSPCLHAAEQQRPDVARKRARWRRHQGRIDPRRLIFVDETWTKTNMTRTHGRALRGQRLVARVPRDVGRR